MLIDKQLRKSEGDSSEYGYHLFKNADDWTWKIQKCGGRNPALAQKKC